MPLSPSYCRDRVPAAPHTALLLLAGSLAFLLLAATELHWRSLGHRPSIVDDAEFWSCWRKQATGDASTVVLLGASRIQSGFSTPVFRRRFPDHRLVQLAVPGEAPVATLRDLAHDDAFRGTVICSMMAGWFLRRSWDRQQDYVDHYHGRSTLNSRWNRLLACAVQSRFVTANPRVGLSTVHSEFVRSGRWPAPNAYTFHFDRSRSVDFSLVDVEPLRQRLLARQRRQLVSHKPADETAFLRDLLEIGRLARRIRSRGGQVVFVRFPTSGERVALDEQMWPRGAYWDRVADGTGVATIHYQDVPSLRGFNCPDMSHLDYRDAPRFTDALLDELVRRGLLSETVAPKRTGNGRPDIWH